MHFVYKHVNHAWGHENTQHNALIINLILSSHNHSQAKKSVNVRHKMQFKQNHYITISTKPTIKTAIKIIIKKLMTFPVKSNNDESQTKKTLQKEQVLQESELWSSTRNKPDSWFLLDRGDFFCLFCVVFVSSSLLSSRAFKSSSLITRFSLETTFSWSLISSNSRSSLPSIAALSWLPLNLPTVMRTQLQ